jgi:hypothetical protein
MAILNNVLQWREKGKGVHGWSALGMRDAWEFLQFVKFCCRIRFLLLVFVVFTNVNIILSSGREFTLLFWAYIIYALFEVWEY